MLKKITFLIVFYTLLNIQSAQSQIVIFNDSTNVSQLFLNECGKSDTFTTFIRVASGSLSGITQYSDTLPDNFIITSFIGHTSIFSVSGIGTNVITFNLDASVLNSVPTTGVYLKFLVRAKCGSNGSLEAPHHMLLTSGAGYNQLKFGQDFVSGIKAPTLIIEARNNVNNTNAEIGNTYSRNWKIRNTGTNSEVDTIWLRIIYQNGINYNSIKIDGSTIVPNAIIGDTVWYKIIKNLRNSSTFLGDTIFVEDSYTVNSCTDVSGSSEISTYYGCYGVAACEVKSVFASTQLPNLVPQITSKVFKIINGCYNAYDTVEIMYINTGTGIANNLKVRFDQSYPIEAYTWPNTASISYIDTASIVTKLGKTSSYAKIKLDSVVNYGVSRPFWPITNPIATVYLKPDTLGAGDTLFVKFLRFRAMYNDILCSTTENYINASATYTNFCGNALYNYNKTNIYGEAHRYYGKTGFNGPAYLVNGDSANFEFTTVRGAGFSHFTKPGYFFMARFNLPPGINWNGDSSNLRLTTVNGVLQRKVDSFSYNSSTGVLEAYYKNFNSVGGVIIKPKFYLDCSVPGAGGTQSISIQYFHTNMVSGCGYQFLPLSCVDNYPVTQICPGSCPRGGVVPYFSQFRRTTFGLPDNDNNGVPDGSGSIDLNKVEWNKLAPRDTFNLNYKGRIIRGSASPSANFTFGYGSIYIPTYANYVHVVGGSIKVKDASSGTTFTVNNLGHTRFDTSGRSRIEFDFSGNTAGFPGGFYYDNNDSFEFTGTFVFNKDVIESGVADNTITTKNSFYVSHYANPTSDTAKYRCLDLPGNYRVVVVYKGYNGGFITRPSGCEQAAMYSDYFQSVGDCCANYAGSLHFPYEYRLFTTLDTIKVKIPTGYILDSTYADYVYTTGAGNAASKRFWSMTPVAVNGEWYSFLLTPYYTFAGGSQVPSTTGSYWTMRNFIRPSCALPIGSEHIQYTADRWIGRNSWSGISLRGVPINHNRGIISYQNAAQLDIANVGPSVVQTPDKGVTWDFQVQNNALSAVATNVWVAFRNLSNKIVVDSVKEISTGIKLNRVNGIYQVGNINGLGAIKTYKIYAKYTACSFDSMKVYTGWSCSGYPANLAATSGSCRPDSTSVYLDPLNPLIQSDLISTPPSLSNLCDTLEWIVSVSNRQIGTAYNVNLDVRIPNGGTGATILPGSGYKYPYNAGSFLNINPVNLGGGIFRFGLSDSITQIKNNGLRPIGELPNNEVYVKIRMVTNCNYVSGSSIRFIARANRACGTALIPDAEFNPLRIIGAPAPKLLIAAGVSGEIRPCNTPIDVNIKLENLEGGNTNSLDSIVIILPSNVEYITGTINFSLNSFTQTVPTIMNVGDRQRLSWCPVPLDGYDSSKFELQVQAKSNTPCGINAELETSSQSTYVASCGVAVCKSSIQNSFDSKVVPVFKPNINILSGNIVVSKDTTLGNIGFVDTLAINNVSMINTGNEVGTVNIKAFKDINFNNKYDVGENLYWNNSSIVLPSGVSRTLDTFINYSHNVLPDTIKVAFSVECNCNNNLVALLPSFLVPLNVEFLNINAVWNNNEKSSAKVNWTVAEDNDLAYYLVERSIGNGKFMVIGQVYSNGNFGQINQYSFEDNNIPNDKSTLFYRIKAVNINQEFSYSKVVSLSKAYQKLNINVYPNPVNDGELTINFTELNGEKITLTMTDVSGKTIHNSEMMIDNNQYYHYITMSNISKGLYLVSIKTEDGQMTSFKIIKN
mgnify:CR=1 FL=1